MSRGRFITANCLSRESVIQIEDHMNRVDVYILTISIAIASTIWRSRRGNH